MVNDLVFIPILKEVYSVFGAPHAVEPVLYIRHFLGFEG